MLTPSSPPIDPVYLSDCPKPDELIADRAFLIWAKDLVRLYAECARGKRVLIDYIELDRD